jgi:hypothetical protein
MKKLNLICAAIALVAGVANAGTLTSATPGGTRFAVEAWGSATDATTAIRPEAATYSVSTTNGIVVNNGGALYYTIKLANAKFNAAPATSLITGTIQTLAGGAAQVTLSDFSADKSTVVYKVTFNANQNIGVGATLIYTPAVGDIVNAKGALSTAGGTVSLTSGLSALAGSATAGSSVPADVDGPAASANIAQSVNGLTLSLSTASLTSKIDVGASPANTAYINGSSTTTGQLGRLKVAIPTDDNGNALPARNLINSADYDIATYAGGTGGTLAVTLTPNSGGAFASVATGGAASGVQGRVYVVGSTTNCAGTALADSGVLTPATAAQPVTLNLAGSAFPAAGADGSVSFVLCQGTSRTAASGAASITPVTPTVAATLNPTTALGANAKSVSGTGYALTYNGATVDTVGYFPASLSIYGYTTLTRVINTGVTATEIRGAFINQATGVAGSSQALPLPANYGATLAPGASVTWTNAQLESALGSPAAADRPRLRITGQTSSLKVQQFVQNANGTFTEVGGSQQ